MLKIYNTLTKKIEPFIPVDKDQVKMYVCGPTVYSHIHIGNARPVIFFDMLKKYLEFIGYNVYYVSNITDIDDKIIEEAKKLNIKEEELTTTYTNAFIEASLSLGSSLPNLMPKATHYIENIITYIEQLLAKDFAYITSSGIYFNTNKLQNYGQLSGQNLEELAKSVRITNQSDKKDFRDFTLWKFTTDGLNFNSPWGNGRPGWHTECAVMNNEIFNGMIDIHGGGSDLVFPHHENENAQNMAIHNHGLSKYWMHVGRVDFDNVKMSKSLGNTVLVKDLIDPISYRLLILAHHYRTPINYSEELKQEFIEMNDRIVRTIKRTHIKLGLNINKDNINNEYLTNFKNEMNNDLNTPNVITLILEIIKNMNKEKDIFKLEQLFNTLNIILQCLSLKPQYNLTKETILLYNSWQEARQNKDFVKADELREKLLKEGWI